VAGRQPKRAVGLTRRSSMAAGTGSAPRRLLVDRFADGQEVPFLEVNHGEEETGRRRDRKAEEGALIFGEMLVVAFVLDAVGYLEKDKRESLDDTAKMFRDQALEGDRRARAEGGVRSGRQGDQEDLRGMREADERDALPTVSCCAGSAVPNLWRGWCNCSTKRGRTRWDRESWTTTPTRSDLLWNREERITERLA